VISQNVHKSMWMEIVFDPGLMGKNSPQEHFTILWKAFPEEWKLL